MPRPYYAPGFRVHINDRSVPAALRASITGISCQLGLEGSDRVELNLANPNLRWLDQPLLALGSSLTLFVGYAPDPLEQVFVGEIVSKSSTFPSSGTPTLTVAAQDRMQRLQRGTKARWFAIPVPSGIVALPDPAVAGIVSVENGLIPLFDPISAALGVLLGNIETVVSGGDLNASQKIVRKQDGESDHEFLKRLALECGWEILIEHTGPLGGYQLRFMSPMAHLAPDVTLQYGQSLIDFTPRISNVGQVASVTAYVWVAALKTQFTVTLGWDWDRMGPTLEIRPEFIPLMKEPSFHLIEEPVTPFTAPRTLLREFIPMLNGRLTGSGSTVGNPRIRAGSVLCLEGLGVEFGGLYRVTSTTHTLDGGGYRTSFEVRKEVWFGSIPLPEQGAVPVPMPVLSMS